MRQQILLCWQTRGARAYSTCLARGEISSRNKSHRYHEITVLAAVPDVATPLLAPPCLDPDVLCQAKTWIPGEGHHENRLRDQPGLNQPCGQTEPDRLRLLLHLLFLGFCSQIWFVFPSCGCFFSALTCGLR